MTVSSSPLLIVSSIPVFTEGLVWAAGMAERPCWVMTDERGNLGWRGLKHVLGVEEIDREMLGTRSEELISLVPSFCEARGIRTLVAADTRGTRFLHRLGPKLPEGIRCFPMCEAELFERMYDKGRFAVLMEELSLPSPSTSVIHEANDVDGLKVGPPWLIKPTQGEGGRGIQKANNHAELRSIIDQHFQAGTSPLVVQAFISGEDIDISVLADRGRCVAWTIQQRGGRGSMRFRHDATMLAIAANLARETEYHGVLHLDLRIDEHTGDVLLIEANPRFWGSLCYSVWSGVNFLDLGIRMMDGEDVTPAFVPAEGTCPYLAPTRSSIARDLFSGWPMPKGLTAAQQRAWRFHHGPGSGALRCSVKAWLD